VPKSLASHDVREFKTTHTHAARAKPGSRTTKKKNAGGPFVFLREFFRSPKVLGAAFPTSIRVGRAMVKGVDLEHAHAVAEYGPGTGAITPAILDRISPSATFFAVERNEKLADVFRERFPDVKLYEDDAANIRDILKKEGVRQLDCIVSALPLLLFPERTRERILREAVGALKQGGVFCQVTYSIDGLPAAKAVRKLMETHFTEVRQAGKVWRNIPPAFVYQCVK